MHTVLQEIELTFRYPVHFTAGVFDLSNPLLRDVIAASGDLPARIVFVVDRGVVRAHRGLTSVIQRYCSQYPETMMLAGRVLVVPGGEKAKNHPGHVKDVQRAINNGGLCRHSYVAAVGGGAVLDVAGYAAATAHRGIRLIRIPTTVLAQDDSGVGVKNSVNAFGKKNYIGTFAPPFAVINDSQFLLTLSDRDWRSGLSEAVKAALIKDASFFADLERHASRLSGRDLTAMEETVRRCATLHCAHIASSGDPFELGSSRPLDFGHWAAHKLEQLTNFRLRHGEAVAIGIALDSTYSLLSGSLPEADWWRIIRLLQELGLAVYAPELRLHLHAPEHPRCVLRGLTEFREHLGGRLTIMLLRAIGKPYEEHEIDAGTMIRSIDILKQFSRRPELPEYPVDREKEHIHAKSERVAG
jgi:3-dehydroquinate synthase